MFLRRKFSPGFSRAVDRLLRSMPGIRHATGAPPAPAPYAATTMEKLDAALNNMSHGFCMFGPDNRLLLWNDRYVKMYKLAPDRLRVGCTLDGMLDARKAAGTAYRDLGQYGSKLLMAMTTRSPDDLVAELDDGRIVWPPMPRPRFIAPRRVLPARARASSSPVEPARAFPMESEPGSGFLI